MLKIAVCDDDHIYLEYVRQYVEQYCEREKIRVVIDYYTDSTLLADQIEEKRGYDAYILDIEMPNITGLGLAEIIQKYSNAAIVIYLTAYEKYAIPGYGLNILAYILKERLDKELPIALSKMFEQIEKWENERFFLISNQRKYIKIPHQEILYVYKRQKNAVFVLKNHQEEWDRRTLQEVYHDLNNPDMFFVDRSLIVNIVHIRRIKDDYIDMIEEHRLTTTKKHILELKEYLMRR